MKSAGFIILFTVFVSWASFAQIREIPQPVREAFANQYPRATQSDFKDHIATIFVHFVQDSAHMIAKYSNKGTWRETERAWTFEQLSPDVRDGFRKSRYADWKVLETAIVYMPGGVERYRVKVEKSDLQRKLLYFEKTGQLVRESISL
jgi:uncharacterized protein (DUF952 family)